MASFLLHNSNYSGKKETMCSTELELPVKKFYLPQLDGLRFFAFLLIFFCHFDDAGIYFPNSSVLSRLFSFLHSRGWVGVDLFFVLSAFLITKLLLLEYKENNSISLRAFWIRRILRIWPLYYLMLCICFIILPLLGILSVPKFGSVAYDDFARKHLLAHLFFLGNFSTGFYKLTKVVKVKNIPIGHLWTVGLEEQFYILWPIAFVYLLGKGKKAIYRTLFLLLCFTISFRWFLTYHSVHPMIWTNTFSRLDPFIFGIILAIYRDNHPGKSKWSILEFIIGLMFILSTMFLKNIGAQSKSVVVEYPMIAIGFALIIDSSIPQGAINGFFSNKVFVWLGKISYGLYIYHIIGIRAGYDISNYLFGPCDKFHIWLEQLFISLGLTILAATISYYYFERIFLKIKKRYSVIASRPV